MTNDAKSVPNTTSVIASSKVINDLITMNKSGCNLTVSFGEETQDDDTRLFFRISED